MSYPFMDDPIPPGHGESQHSLDATMDAIEKTPQYSVIVVLGDGVPTVEKRFADLGEALEYRTKVAQELKDANYRFSFCGVMDEDDPERGWLEDED
jgi:hypothetical protein